MRLLFLLVLICGIGIAGFAAYLAFDRFSAYDQELQKYKKLAAERVDTTEVAIAKGDLIYGQELTKEDVVLVRFPTSAIPAESFASIEEVFGKDEDEEKPRIVLRAIDANEVISKLKVTAFGEDAGVASRLEKGKRAFTLKVDVASGVSGLLRPGDRIDVYWTGRTENATVSRLILDGIRLLAIDQDINENRNRPTVARTVTVAVTPQLVGALVQAQATGKLQLSLRGIGDETESGTIQVDQADLLGDQKKKVCTIKSRKGGEVTITEIPCEDAQ